MARLGGEEALAASAALMADRVASVKVVLGVRLRQGRAGGRHRPAGAGIDVAETRLQAQEYLIDVGVGSAPTVAAALSGPAEKRIALVEVLGVVGGSQELPAVEAQHAIRTRPSRPPPSGRCSRIKARGQ